MASSPPSWIILGNVARVSATDAGADDLPLGADLAFALAAPPRVTLLTVPQRVSPDPDEYTMVLAVDPPSPCSPCPSSRPRGIAFRPWVRFQQTQSRSHRKAPRIVMWTLADSDTGEWKVEHRVNFADIWADDSYKETGLFKRAPVLALVHPQNPDVVYFFLVGKHIFGVNLRARKVVV